MSEPIAAARARLRADLCRTAVWLSRLEAPLPIPDGLEPHDYAAACDALAATLEAEVEATARALARLVEAAS